MKVLILFLIFILFNVTESLAQDKPCSKPEFSQFDFWIGTWDLEWTNDKGVIETGTNTINKILGGCVIEENFTTSDGSFTGKSHSTFSLQDWVWKQTWVDDAGGYMDFKGSFENGNMTLNRKTIRKDGVEVTQRMVFTDITANTLTWNWESSFNDGKTWTTNWSIRYKRR